MANKVYEVEVLNWDKFQGRSDVKNASWLKLHHNTFFSPGLINLSAEGKLLWFYILCEASRSSKRGFATISPPSCHHTATIGFEAFNHSLLHLQQYQMVRVRTLRARNASGTYACTREEKRREEEIRSTSLTDVQADPTGAEPKKTTELDFEILYQNYPRKRGKSRGIAICKRQIKSLKNYEDLDKAIKNYALETRGRDQDKIMHFSTFMGEWTDWIDVDLTAKSTGQVLIGF